MDYWHMVTGLILVGLFFWLAGFVSLSFRRRKWLVGLFFLIATLLTVYFVMLVIAHAYNFS